MNDEKLVEILSAALHSTNLASTHHLMAVSEAEMLAVTIATKSIDYSIADQQGNVLAAGTIYNSPNSSDDSDAEGNLPFDKTSKEGLH